LDAPTASSTTKGTLLTTSKRYRAENVGSLLQPESLLAVRKAFAEGAATKDELTKVEDEAVLAAIQLQESVGPTSSPTVRCAARVGR